MENVEIIVDNDSPKSLAMDINLGNTALASDTEVLVYFTFDGLTHLLEGEPLLDAGMPIPYDMLEWDRESIDEEVTTKFAGAATFLEDSENADQVLTF